MSWRVFNVPCLELTSLMKPDSVDAVITDPPYGLSFMGKDWDRAVPPVEWWKGIIRVMKPGAFAAVLCTPRQDCQARMVMNLETAGFVTGFTSIMWTYATGLPKAANLSKLADKRAVVSCPDCDGRGGVISTEPTPADEDLDGEVTEWDCAPAAVPCERCKGSGKVKGAVREIVGVYSVPPDSAAGNAGRVIRSQVAGSFPHDPNPTGRTITAPATPEAKALDGGYAGYQPKPAFEPILVVMKPLAEKTYLDQALANGHGCSWLDDARIPASGRPERQANRCPGFVDVGTSCGSRATGITDLGRFPANVLCCDDVMDDGRVSKSTGGASPDSPNRHFMAIGKSGMSRNAGGLGDSGSYSRYFDLDAWWAERIAQLPEEVQRVFPWLIVPKPRKREKGTGNKHPTVKPIKLMSYLTILFSRPGDLVLDPFIGSGTTGVAATILRRRFIGCDIDEESVELSRKRIKGDDGE